MDKAEAGKFAAFKMIEHGLIDKGWRFQFDTAISRFGYCSRYSRTISLSGPLTELNSEAEVKDTIIHEIAHALTPSHGHDDVWKRKCVELGCKPIRCYSSKTVVSPEVTKYRYECPSCGRQMTKTYIMRTSPRACGACCRKHNNAKFSNDFVFQLVETIRPGKSEMVAKKRSFKVGDKYHG